MALLVLVLAVVTAIRVRLLALPLERDEGEYAYAGQLLLQGVAPYQGVYSMKWPGTFAAYAVLMKVFGQSSAGIHSGLLFINLITALIVFLIGKRIYGPVPASVATATYALLSISPATLGLAAHATHFVLLPALVGIFLLQTLNEHTPAWRVALAGSLFGLAALMKQSGAIFGLFGALWLLWLEKSCFQRDVHRLPRRLAWLALGGLLPLLLTAAFLAKAGVLARFWFWTVKYGQAYAGVLTPFQGVQFLLQNAWQLLQAAPGLWALALLGLVLLWFAPHLQPWRFFLTGFSLFSFLSVCPGWYFREHYFLLLLPAAGLLAGAAIDIATWFLSAANRAHDSDGPGLAPVARPSQGLWHRALPQSIPMVVFALAAIGSLYTSRVLFFRAAPEAASRSLYPGNAFPECVQLGRFLSEHCSPEGRIAVLGSEPELFFYSHRRSATGYVYMYPLMEPQPYAKLMQEEMMREVVATNPDYFVFVAVSSSWLARPDSDLSILNWFEAYRREHLRSVALVQIFSDDHIEYDWSGSNKPEATRPKRWLEIYQKTGN